MAELALRRGRVNKARIFRRGFYWWNDERVVKKEVLARGLAETRKSANPRATCGRCKCAEVISD